MIWMTWRQLRTQMIVAGAALLAIAVYLVILGLQIRHTYDGDLALCQRQGGGCGSLMAEFTSKYQARLLILGALLVLVPGFLGIFWGAPLVARELETGTHRLVWNQSVTRQRWLAAKLLFVGTASVAVAGVFSLLLTWAASPYDLVTADRFDTVQFGMRNIAPVAYAVFAFVLGTILGLTLRRTVPAMALTIVLFAVVQIVMPTLVRAHLMSPENTSQPMTEDTIKNLTFLGSQADIGGLRIPDAWVVSTSRMLTASGGPVDLEQYNACFEGGADCLAKLNLHVQVSYQPAYRYWYFQWLESAIFLTLSALLVAFGRWRIQRRTE